MKMNNGITLIALVITIIILLILAGITISLTIGDNGILNKAENAGEEYIKASIKEELELAIMDINAELASKNPAEGLTKQAIIDRIQDHVQEMITIDNALEGNYKDYDYWIDDDYVVHIGDKNVLPMKADLTAKKGTTYITATVDATSNYANIVGYIYLVDGVATEQKTENVYIINGLEPESTHTIKAIAIDEKGNRTETRTLTLTTEARTYIYQNGVDNTKITNGWETVRKSHEAATPAGTPVFSMEANYINCVMNRPGSGHHAGVVQTKNTIDLTAYRTMTIKYNSVLDVPNQASTVYAIINRAEDPYSTVLGIIKTGNQKEFDISNIQGEYNIGVHLQSQFNGTAYCKVYEIYLDK